MDDLRCRTCRLLNTPDCDLEACGLEAKLWAPKVEVVGCIGVTGKPGDPGVPVEDEKITLSFKDCISCTHYKNTDEGLRCILGIPCIEYANWKPRPPFDHVEDNNSPRILDSGERREFPSGAVRDIQKGKGRMDLVPFDVISGYYHNYAGDDGHNPQSWVFWHLNHFKKDGQIGHLYDVLRKCKVFPDFETMILEVSKHYEAGAEKYGENNWQKGLDVYSYIDSAARHYLKFLRGDKDEPHDRAFIWNVLSAIWTCKNKPELNGYAVKDLSDEQKSAIADLHRKALFGELTEE